MRQKKTRYCFLFLFLLLYAGNAYTADKLIFSGIIRDAVTHETLPYATVLLESEETRRYSAIAGDDGTFRITDVFPGIYKLTVSFIGYGRQQRTVELKKSTYMTIGLRSDNQLKEVVITATESKGLVSSSKIDRPAMQHLQPTSFADLLELLPGGMSRDPKAETPAVKYEDGEDYVPSSKFTVFSHQFSSIAGAGPVTGPILASVFGWVPVLLWLFDDHTHRFSFVLCMHL